MSFILAVKSAPEERILSDAERAGIKAVELYLSKSIMSNASNIIKICKKFTFIYSVHAPNDDFNPEPLMEICQELNAGIVVFHDIFWEDEWKEIITKFNKRDTRLCIENVRSIIDWMKFKRRYGLGYCLDLEHLQFEIGGIFEEEFSDVIRGASHIHLTGYIAGSQLWHTHIHHSPQHAWLLFNIIKKASYSGMVVSEAKVSLQTYEEFKKLNEFYLNWLSTQG